MLPIHLHMKIYENKERLFAKFEYNKQLVNIIRKIKGAQWSSSEKEWHFPLVRDSVQQIIFVTKGVAAVDISELRQQLIDRKKHLMDIRFGNIDEATRTKILQFKHWMEQKRYSDQTIKNYIGNLIQFFKYYAPLAYDEITADHVSRYNYNVIVKNGLSVSFQKGIVGAVKLFYSYTKDSKMSLERLQHPKVEKRLPEVLSKGEIERVLDAAANLKHKALLSITYACGLRRSEVLNLKIKDLDSNRKLIRIEQAKGNKDRYVPFSDKLKCLLQEYYKMYHPKEYLFEGQKGTKYGERSFELVLAHCVKKAGIVKRVTLHTLRHSYATHHLEAGTDLRYIQELLGHNSPRTTMIYTHVSNRKIAELQSPFDDLKINETIYNKNNAK